MNEKSFHQYRLALMLRWKLLFRFSLDMETMLSIQPVNNVCIDLFRIDTKSMIQQELYK